MVKIRRRPSGRASIRKHLETSDDWKPEELRPDPVEGLREHTIGQARSLRSYRPEDEKDTFNHKKTTDKEADKKAAEKDEKIRESQRVKTPEGHLIEAIDKRRERSKKYLEGEAKKRNKKDDEKEAKKAEEQIGRQDAQIPANDACRPPEAARF
jgi:hypothetical protein